MILKNLTELDWFEIKKQAASFDVNTWNASTFLKCKQYLCIFLASAMIHCIMQTSMLFNWLHTVSQLKWLCRRIMGTHHLYFIAQFCFGAIEVFFSKEAASDLVGPSHENHLSCFTWGHRSTLSSGGLDLTGRLSVKVLPDGVVVYGCSHRHKQVPNGMSKWDNAITFKKDNPQRVAGSAKQQLAQPRLFRLGGRRC